MQLRTSENKHAHKGDSRTCTMSINPCTQLSCIHQRCCQYAGIRYLKRIPTASAVPLLLHYLLQLDCQVCGDMQVWVVPWFVIRCVDQQGCRQTLRALALVLLLLGLRGQVCYQLCGLHSPFPGFYVVSLSCSLGDASLGAFYACQP